MRKTFTILTTILLLFAVSFVIAMENETENNSTSSNETEIMHNETDMNETDTPEEEVEKETAKPSNNDYTVESITLKIDGSRAYWKTEGISPEGYKAVWSKSENPVYPPRDGDQANYVSSHDDLKSWLNAFDGSGTYYVRVCAYLEGECFEYSNQASVELGDDHKKDYEKEDYNSEGKDYEKEDEFKKPIHVDEEEELSCNGCILEDTCYPLGWRTSGMYCSGGLEFINQSSEGDICENSFECDSNVCISGECVSASLIQKMLNWFKDFFG